MLPNIPKAALLGACANHRGICGKPDVNPKDQREFLLVIPQELGI